jgi:hypothetical protein
VTQSEWQGKMRPIIPTKIGEFERAKANIQNSFEIAEQLSYPLGPSPNSAYETSPKIAGIVRVWRKPPN